jgi:type I restriction-modification system DNA methylase subunit
MLQNIKDLVSTLWFEKDKKKARDIGINLANQLLLLMGAPEKKIKLLKDIYNAALPPSYFNNQKIESWFEPHPFFNGPVALKLYDDKNSAFESSFFHLSETATKARIAATTLLGINWEDLEIYELPKYKIGIDFFLNFESNSLLLVISRKGNVRVIEFSERLTHTQEEILQKLSESKGVLAFEGFDLKTGQLLPREPQKTIHEILWKELQVNEVNKKFYTGIADHFDQLTKSLLITKQIKEKKDAQLFSSRLIGRLLFIWFLKKVNLVNNKMNYFDLENKNSTDYYEMKLKPLFFEVLNTPIEERKFIDIKTPFLNGGLFEPYSNDFYSQKIFFLDDFFPKLYSHLNEFNFTVDESTPEYEQIAIDPEMLGRVFENLLASIVPETADAANERKNKGAFYTPREIVSFMCKESLKEYLKSKLNEESLFEGINKLIDLNDANFVELKSTGLANLWGIRSKDVVPKIIHLLNEIKIFDPACGSGAFPIGMLQLISRSYDRLGAKYDISENKHVLGLNKGNFSRYYSKLSIIKNNLFGSDIEPMAIEIARLRCWLSLIIEEKSNVHPLPNLDFNFVCSNTLIKLNKQYDIFGGMEFEEKLRELTKKYYLTHSKLEKNKIKKVFAQQYSVNFENQILSDTRNQLLTWNPFDISKPADFFDSLLMFSINEFDIVIANPPYIHFETIKEVSYKLYKPLGYYTYEPRGDIYTLFYELGIQLLRQNGVLCYITSNKWMRAEYGNKLRKYILDHSTPLKLIDLGAGIFDAAAVDTNILLLTKTKIEKATLALAYNNNSINTLGDNFISNAIQIKFDKNKPWAILNPIEQSIQNKIERNGVLLGEMSEIQINMGLKTGLNEAFVVDEETKNKILEGCETNQEKDRTKLLIKPILRGKDISRYSYKWSGLFIILTHNGYTNSKGTYIPPINIENYHSIKKHLDKFKNDLSKRLDKGDTIYNLRDCSFLDVFKKDKIFWSDISTEPSFVKVSEEYLILNTAYMITGFSNWLIDYLNSDIVSWYFPKISSTLGNEGNRYFKQFVERIPIPKKFDINNPYAQFGFSEEEIKFIEQSNPKNNHTDS